MSLVVGGRGIRTNEYHGDLGRTTKTTEEYTDGTVTNNTNKTTEFTYDGDIERNPVRAGVVVRA